MKTFSLLILFWLAFPFGSNDNLPLAQLFIKDLSDKNISLNSIVEKHICESHNDGSKKLVLFQLEYIRKQLLSSSNKQPVIKPYNELKPEEQNLLLGEDEQKDLFKVTCNGKFICWVWLKNKRVAAFASLNKGGKGVLMPICK